MPTNSISRQCPGKINLYLDITAKRENGYHDIETLFLPINSPSDIITITPKEQNITIDCSHAGVPCDSRNLCYKAAELFFEQTQIEEGCHIELKKNLPVAGGMGGGSSNAAAALSLLNELYNHPLQDEELQKICLKIGADVPFFLKPEPAFAKGIGEELKSINHIPSLYIVLITFDFPISAAWAYQNRLLPPGAGPFKLNELIKSLQNKNIQNLDKLIYNDLALAIRKKFPILQKAQNDAIENGAITAEVSGSGPTIFAVCTDLEKATELKKSLIQKNYTADKIFICQTQES